jgi:hypothetical protein
MNEYEAKEIIKNLIRDGLLSESEVEAVEILSKAEHKSPTKCLNCVYHESLSGLISDYPENNPIRFYCKILKSEIELDKETLSEFHCSLSLPPIAYQYYPSEYFNGPSDYHYQWLSSQAELEGIESKSSLNPILQKELDKINQTIMSDLDSHIQSYQIESSSPKPFKPIINMCKSCIYCDSLNLFCLYHAKSINIKGICDNYAPSF